MKLTEIKFQKFKTIKGESLEVEKDITCLVGINEAGKSNLLWGIEKCDVDGKLTQEDISRHSDEYLKGGSPSLEMTLIPSNEEERKKLQSIFGHDDVDEIIIVKTDVDQYRIDHPALNYEKSQVTLEHLESKPKTEEPSKVELDDTDKDSIRKKIVEQLKGVLPRFRYFDSVDFDSYFLPEEGDISIKGLINDPNSNAPVINLLKLAGISPQDLEKHVTPQEKNLRDTRLETGTNEVNKKLLRASWPVESVQLDLTAEADTLKIRVKESRPFLPRERSRGLQWALAFNIFFLASTDEDLANTVLLIDEPGIFLHIEGQRKMITSTFPEITKKGNQIVYTTHLPYLIDKNHPERIRILEKDKEDTVIGNKAWSQSEFGSIPEPVRTGLGFNVEEAFLFSDKNLVVEGPADHIYLRLFLQKYEPDILEKISIVPAYGVDKVPKVMGLAMLSDKAAYGVIDADKDLDNIKDKFKKIGVEKPNLENLSTLIGNEKVETIEDVLPSTGFRDAVFKVYKKEFEKRKRKLNLNEIPTDLPRNKSVEEFLRLKLSSPKHNLLKMDVARSFKEIVETSVEFKPQEWLGAKSLAKSIVNFMNEKASSKKDKD